LDDFQEAHDQPTEAKDSTEHLSGGIEYPDRIRVHAALNKIVGGVGSTMRPSKHMDWESYYTVSSPVHLV
jgi:hypothetical protein